MSDHEDNFTMRDVETFTKRDIPAVPKPDWSIDNFKNTGHKVDEITATYEREHYQNTEKNNSLKCNTPSTSSNNSTMSLAEPSQKTNRPAVVENASTNSALRVGDVPSTPTHSISTPVFNSVNPHSTMTAATPAAAASGVNQAINSIKLQNCVSTVNVGCELQLLDIYCKTRYSEYNPQRFQGVVMKLMDPRATALIFRSGKIVCTGARNEYDSYIAARKFSRIIERLGFPAKFLDFKIQNFCATADLKFPIRLEALQQAHGQFASYEPELFPGLVYRMVRPRVVLLIFVNGKIVFTGGKNRNEITEALEIIYPILRGYRIS